MTGQFATLSRSGCSADSRELPRARSRAFAAKSGVSDPSSHPRSCLSATVYPTVLSEGGVRRVLGSRRAHRVTARRILLFHRLTQARGLASRSLAAGTGSGTRSCEQESELEASPGLIPFDAPSGIRDRYLGIRFPGSHPSHRKRSGDFDAFSVGLQTAPLGAGVPAWDRSPPPDQMVRGFLTAAAKVLGSPADHEGQLLRRLRPGSLGAGDSRSEERLHLRRSGPPEGSGLETCPHSIILTDAEPESRGHRLSRALWPAVRAGDTLLPGCPFIGISLQAPYRPIGRFPEEPQPSRASDRRHQALGALV